MNLVELRAEAEKLEKAKAAFRTALYSIQAEIVANDRKIREASALEAKKP